MCALGPRCFLSPGGAEAPRRALLRSSGPPDGSAPGKMRPGRENSQTLASRIVRNQAGLLRVEASMVGLAVTGSDWPKEGGGGGTVPRVG